MCLLGCVSASVRGNFLKIHTSHSSRMRYTRRKFGRGRPIIKGTLPEEQCAFSAVSRLPME